MVEYFCKRLQINWLFSEYLVSKLKQNPELLIIKKIGTSVVNAHLNSYLNRWMIETLVSNLKSMRTDQGSTAYFNDCVMTHVVID